MKLRECLKSFGWCGVRVEEIHATFSGEIKAMLEIHTRRMVEDEWSWRHTKVGHLVVNLGAWT